MSSSAEISVIEQGFDLMIYGMGSVFVFLTLLVIGTMLMSKLVSKMFPQQESALSAATPTHAAAATEHLQARDVAVIEDAIRQYRAK